MKQEAEKLKQEATIKQAEAKKLELEAASIKAESDRKIALEKAATARAEAEDKKEQAKLDLIKYQDE